VTAAQAEPLQRRCYKRRLRRRRRLNVSDVGVAVWRRRRRPLSCLMASVRDRQGSEQSLVQFAPDKSEYYPVVRCSGGNEQQVVVSSSAANN